VGDLAGEDGCVGVAGAGVLAGEDGCVAVAAALVRETAVAVGGAGAPQAHTMMESSDSKSPSFSFMLPSFLSDTSRIGRQ
jgi:hypothetical protein